MIAVSIPLYFYSQKIIFDAEYKAAKSELLQGWLRENNLELEGPNPPVGIRNLYERALE